MDLADALKDNLTRIPWFRELSPQHLEKIAQITHLRAVKAGDILFREGDKADHIYIILEGRIALEMAVPPRGKVRFYTAELWELVGWSSVTPTVHQRTAGAVAVTDSLLAAVDAEKLRQLCEDDHDLGYLTMRRLANIVASRLMVTRLQLLDIFAEPENKHAK